MSAPQLKLPATGFLEALSDEELNSLATLGEGVAFEEGGVVIQEGEPQDHLYVLINGKAKVLQKRVAPAVTAWLEAGESCGEVNLFDFEGAGASASVVAAETSLFWRINREGLNTYIGQNPAASLRLTIGLATLLSKRLRAMNGLVQEMSVWTHS